MSDSGSSWAPFGPSSGRGDDDGPPEPEPKVEPEVEPPPVAFTPPAPAPLPPLPARPPVAEPSPLAWPDPAPRAAEPQPERQAPWPPQGFQERKPVPSDATVALVLGIASLLFWGIIGPLAIFYGIKARRQIDGDPALGGRGLATWGLALGVVTTTLLVIGLGLIAAGIIVLT